MSFLIDAAVAAVLGSSLYQPVARLLSLNPDGSVRAIWSADPDPSVAHGKPIATAGSATEDRTRLVRGSSTLQIVNADVSLSPNGPGDPFFTDELFRLERGALVDGIAFFIPVGTYVVSSYDDDSISRTLAIQGDDPLILAQQDFGEVVTLNKGTSGADCVRIVLGPFVPVLGDPDSWSLDDGGQSLGALRSFVEDDKRLVRLVSLLGNLGLELFADRYGAPVLQPIPDPTTLAPSASYRTDPGAARLLGLHRSGSWHAVNHVVVIGEAPGRVSVRGQADITDTSSPFHASRIGPRPAPIFRSAEIVTQDQANAKAANLLISYLFGQDAINASLPADLSLAAGDVVDVAVGGTNGRFWTRTRTLPFLTGTMAIAAPRVVPVFAQPDAVVAA